MRTGRPWCAKCDGRGIIRETAGRYVRCDCGRLPDSKGAALLAKQEKLDKRLEEIRLKGL